MRRNKVAATRFVRSINLTPLYIILIVWGIMNLVAFTIGVSDAEGRRYHCFDPMERIEYIFPGHQFGCYMGQPPDGKKNEEN